MDKQFSALGSQHRLQILQYLCKAPSLVVASLAASDLKMTLSSFSYHLSVLEDAGLIERTSQGRFTVPIVNHKIIKMLEDFLNSLHKEH